MRDAVPTEPSAWLDQPSPTRPGEELDVQRLDAYLREHVLSADERARAAGSLVIEQFPRGFSNLTYLLRLGNREMVLRRPPFGANIKSAHDMGREYRILRGLIGVYPRVPRTLAYCEDLSVLGAPFYLMERVHGVILRFPLQMGLSLGAEQMRRTCLGLIDTLVELHGVDYEAAGLGSLGHPEGYVARQIGGWTQRYQNAQTDDIPEMEQLAGWLAAHLPPESGAALIHNDYRYDNVIFDPASLSCIIAILDWEMATLGDPLMDVGTTLAYWAEPGDPPEVQRYGLSTLPGNLDRRQFVERYAERSGRALAAMGTMLFYYVYGLFKLGVIVQQIYRRYRLGITHDERFAGLIDAVRADSRQAVRAIERDRIHSLGAKA